MNKKNINQETSQIAWQALQPFFARGQAIYVTSRLDLVEVAYQFSIDNKAQVEQWLTEEEIAAVSNRQALQWYESNATVWAVVVKPWVLVQGLKHRNKPLSADSNH